MSAPLVKTRTVMQMRHVFDGKPCFTNSEPEDGDTLRYHTLWLDQGVYDDMGCPATITVTIEPGDKLNDGSD